MKRKKKVLSKRKLREYRRLVVYYLSINAPSDESGDPVVNINETAFEQWPAKVMGKQNFLDQLNAMKREHLITIQSIKMIIYSELRDLDSWGVNITLTKRFYEFSLHIDDEVNARHNLISQIIWWIMVALGLLGLAYCIAAMATGEFGRRAQESGDIIREILHFL